MHAIPNNLRFSMRARRLSAARGVWAAGPLLVLVAACATAPLQGPAAATPEAPLAGPWVFTVTQASGAALDVRMTFERQPDQQWVAFSREGAAAEMVSGTRALIGRILGRFPPRGALLRIEGGTLAAQPEGALFRGRLRSPMLGDRWLQGTLRDGRLTGELFIDTTAAAVGTFDATPAISHAPLRDYAALGRRIEHEFAANFFDPLALRQPEWRRFFDALSRRLVRARDDLDAMTAFYAARAEVAVSHVELFRHPEMGALSGDALLEMYGREDPERLVGLSFPAPGVALLRVVRWYSVTPVVERAFARIDSAGAHTLILDIRGNPGGDVSSMAPAAHLVRDTTIVGVFLGNRWFSERRNPPASAEMHTLPRVTEEAGVSTILGGVREHGVLVGVLPPKAPHFAGDVYLLTDSRSASASEPLAYLLKTTERAVLVGERTAGAMLSGPPHPVGDGWILVLPVADYYAADGTRLEGRGVAPHIAVSGAQAMVAVAERMRAARPYAGALLLGAAHAGANRNAEAEQWYAEARRLEPDSAAPLQGLALLYAQQRRWSETFAAHDAVLARNPRDLSSLYQLGRVAALSGERLHDGEASLRAYLASPHRDGLPGHAAAHWRLGQIRLALGDRDGAVSHFETAVRLDPDNADYAAALRAARGQ